MQTPRSEVWTLGAPQFDDCLPGGGFDPAALIELKPSTYGDWPVTLAFAACLAIRRRRGLEKTGGAPSNPASRPILWCFAAPFISEHGRLHGPGLADLGLASDGMIAVEAPRGADALWALEEGLRSRTLSLAVGVLREVDLTPCRRLGLAAAAGETPALLLTLPASAPAPAAGVRLRINRRPSASHPFDSRAPGAPRFGLMLERCRSARQSVEALSFELEWCDVTYRFHLATELGDRADAAAGAGSRAG